METGPAGKGNRGLVDTESQSQVEYTNQPRGGLVQTHQEIGFLASYPQHETETESHLTV